MKNRKTIIVIACSLGVGIFLGWLFFASSDKTSDSTSNNHNHSATENSEQIWTCSMHPQIRKNEPGACPICGMDLIPLDENSSGNPFVLEMSEEAVKISQIQTTLVGGSNFQNSELELSGKIEVNETNSASLVTHIPGRIEKLYVSYTGEKSEQGSEDCFNIFSDFNYSSKELLEAQKIKGSQPQLFEAAKNKLKYWKITESQIQEILSQEEVIETFNIYAAYSGVVNERKVSVGDYKQEGNVLFEIQNLNSLWVVFDVYEKDISTVNVGDIISFSTTSNPGKNYESRIVFIDPVLNSQTRTAKVRAEISNTASNLKPEMFVRGKLIGNTFNSSEIVVPKSAVMWTGTRSVVYVQLANTEIPSFEYREVVLGASIGNNYEIISGLSAGEYVVTQGAFVIDASAQLNNQASMMNQMSTPNEGKTSDVVPDYSSSTPEAFKDQLEQVLEAYYSLKESLVSSDKKQASIASNKLLLNLQKTDMTLVKGDAHIYWMKKSNQLSIQANSIKSTKEIAEQRKVFAQMSLSIIEVIKAFGIGGDSYEMYCPMTNNKQGAYWLSAETEIRNPYYGDKMMGCGEIRNELSFE